MSSSYSYQRWIAWGFVLWMVVLMMIFAGAAIFAASAQAQEQTPQNNETAIDEQVQDQLGDLVIHTYDYDGSTETMTIEASWTGRAPTRATFVEMIELDSGGSTKLSFQRIRLTPDQRTEITVSVEKRTGGTAAVLVTTPESIDRGDALVLQDGDPTDYPAIRFQNVLLAIFITSIGSAGMAFVFVLKKKHTEESGVDRIA
jgi:hypothetical protein